MSVFASRLRVQADLSRETLYIGMPWMHRQKMALSDSLPLYAYTETTSPQQGDVQ